MSSGSLPFSIIATLMALSWTEIAAQVRPAEDRLI